MSRRDFVTVRGVSKVGGMDCFEGGTSARVVGVLLGVKIGCATGEEDCARGEALSGSSG